jgi:hypothetical protein
MGIGRNQKDFLGSGALDDLGSSKEGGVVPMGAVENALTDFAIAFMRDATANLEQSNAVSSGTLSESMTFNISEFGNAYRLTINLADYYDFVNKGVKGVKASVKAPDSPYQFKNLGVSQKFQTALKSWIRREGLKTRLRNEARVTEAFYPNRKTKVLDPETSQAKSIGRAIKWSGLRATHFLDNAYDKNYPELAGRISEALGGAFSIYMRNTFENVDDNRKRPR